jgi:hypothetical protein
MLIHHWSHPTTPAGIGWDIVQSNVVRLTTEKGFIARAALGEAEIIRVIVDDPTGAADYKTLHRWYMVEDETPGDQLVWNGYISDQWIDRGDEGDLIFPTGVGRRWELEITQENTLLGFRVIQGAADAAHGKRPAESPGERLAWILGSPFLSTVFDHGLIDWTALNALPDMDPVDYHGKTAADVLRDISLKSQFNHYARYRDASSDIELAFHNANTSTLDSSTLRVSNVEADVDFATTWPPFFAGYRLHRKGDRVSAGVYVQGDKFSSYGFDLDTSYEFGFRDMVAPDNNTTTQAGADRLRDQLLAQHDEQDERIEGLRIQVPAANLNDVKHGQRIEAKFAHLPGWESFRWARVVSKAFSRPENDTQALYDVDLELSPQSPIVTASGILYYANTGSCNGPAVQIVWQHVGEGSPCVQVAKVGPIEYGPIITTDNPLVEGGGVIGHSGWTINAQGTINLHAYGSIFGQVVAGGIATIRWLMNGVDVHQTVIVEELGYDDTFTLDCPLASGNVLTATYEHNQPGGFSGLPGGTGGCGEVLHLTSASLIEPG